MRWNIILSLSGLACLLPGGAATFVVTGATTGGTQPRLEVRDLAANHPPMWNLFLQSLESMQKENQNGIASYYQISGIHGAPFIPWDGVGQSGSGGGYCPHSSNLFGPWHRPYLALFEQRLSFWAHKIAAKFPAGPQRQKYQTAADNLRLPYWDWALNISPIVPRVMSQAKIQVSRPNGQKQSIRNPLSLYHFHPLDSAALPVSPQNTWDETKRAPNGAGQSNPAQVESFFQNNHAGVRQETYHFLIDGGRYNAVSHGGIGGAGNNVEGIHNGIHTSFGANSHMSNPTVAAFDPAFWLHHNNIDRLLAIWQYLYPQTYVEPTVQGGGTFTIQSGSTQGPTSPLAPFHSNSQGTFWTSNSARDVQAFHYTYPELLGNPSQASVRQKVNSLYQSAVGVSASVENSREEGSSLRTVPNVNVTMQLEAGDTVYGYLASIVMPMSLNDQGYGVYVFLGEKTEEDPADWLLDPNLAGSQISLGNPGKVDGTALMNGTVFLTQAIMEKYGAGELDGLDRDTVVDYLTNNLYWRAQQNGQPIPPDVNIQVHLVSAAIEIPAGDDEFPNTVDKNTIAPIDRIIAGV